MQVTKQFVFALILALGFVMVGTGAVPAAPGHDAKPAGISGPTAPDKPGKIMSWTVRSSDAGAFYPEDPHRTVSPAPLAQPDLATTAPTFTLDTAAFAPLESGRARAAQASTGPASHPSTRAAKPVRVHFVPRLSSRHALISQRILRTATRYMGTPYVWAGTGGGGFDCSGFTMRVFMQNGIPLRRQADWQFTQGQKIARADLQPGDLVFFSTYAPGASHVGIYIGNNQFIHASSSRGVTISSLGESYYSKCYIGARRMY